MFELYLEICAAFRKAGGTYYKIDLPFYQHLIRCVVAGQYYLECDKSGDITQFMMWWFIAPEEVCKTVDYAWYPKDVTAGQSIHIVDYINTTGRMGMARMMKTLRAGAFAGHKGISWLHRNTERLQYFPSIKGADL